MMFCPPFRGLALPAQGGVAVLARRCLNAGFAIAGASDLNPEVVPGRLLGVPVRYRGIGVVFCYSGYFRTGEGLSIGNAEILASHLEHCRLHGLPWNLFADFNMEPSQLSPMLSHSTQPLYGDGGPERGHMC